LGFILLAGITFLSAFLLFQIELIVAKLFLPIYGGSYLVWGACVVFFQGILLLGYVFAHKLIVRNTITAYLKIHLGLLLLSFFFFPGRMIHISHEALNLPLVIDIFFRLLISIGPVFFVLSTMSLVTQSWLSFSTLKQKQNPYALYAVSNLGSFVGLLTYPFVFELFLTNTQQLNLWRVCYVALVLLNILAYRWIPVNLDLVSDEHSTDNPRQSFREMIRWFCLSAASVILFLSVTNIMTYEISPVPLLWIIPLSIYLFSFVLNFKNKPFSPAWVHRFIFLIIGFAIVYYFFSKMLTVPALFSTIVFNILLFVLCMYAQGELIRSKPPSRNLTAFYVMISFGGFLGGILTSWVIPVVSTTLIEFLVGLLLLAFASRHKGLIAITILSIIFSPTLETFIRNHDSVFKKRNYYGIYDVFNKRGVRVMLHGTILHGMEFIEPKRHWVPLGYYSPTAALGDIFGKDIFNVHRIAGIGLGAGTVAMYSKGDCPIDFYELDPDVVSLAKNQFWYLSSAPGEVNILLGDARISIEKQKDVFYDIILVDAFGGDSIPTHLVNNDVVRLYKKHLNQGGAILFHIPNRYFDLKPILANIAYDLGAWAAFKSSVDDGVSMRTVWGIITWDQQEYLKLITQQNWEVIDVYGFHSIRSWSDDYSTILPIINWSQIRNSFRSLSHIY